MGISLVLVFGTPFQMHPARNSISHVIFSKESDELSIFQYMTLTIAIFVGMYGVATQVTDLGTVLEWVGAICGTTLVPKTIISK